MNKNEIKSIKMLKIIILGNSKNYDIKKGVFMGKSKSLGYQIHSALNLINLQEADKRTAVFNRLNDTDLDYVGKREFKKLGQTKDYIFSKRTAENTSEKAKTFCTFLKENYSIRLVKEITPQMAIEFLKSKEGCSSKTISSYKNMLYKVSVAIQLKFHTKGFYNKDLDDYKPPNTYKSNSERLYTDKQIEQIINYPSNRRNELQCMAFTGCRVHEMINIKVSDVDLDGRTIHIIGKGGKDTLRPLTPQGIHFLKEMIRGKELDVKIFNLPKSEKATRQIMSNEIRKITTALNLPVSGKNHEFRKYAAQQFCSYLINQKGWTNEKAREFVSSKFLAHGIGREDIKRIYLDS